MNTEYVVMPREDYELACNKLREKTDSPNLIKSGELVQRIEEVYEKGKAEVIPAKEEQEKSVTITKNGTTEVLPDEHKALSKVTVNVDVPSDDVFSKIIDGSITEVVVPENITRINHYAFANCQRLSKVVLHEKITTLGFSSFYLCTNLKSLTLPASITEMHRDAIQRCDNMVNLTVNCVIKTAFNINYLKKLTTESVESVVNALADLTGQTSQILSVHSVIFDYIVANEQLYNIIKNKNWKLQ